MRQRDTCVHAAGLPLPALPGWGRMRARPPLRVGRLSPEERYHAGQTVAQGDGTVLEDDPPRAALGVPAQFAASDSDGVLLPTRETE